MTTHLSSTWHKVRSGIGHMRLRRTPLDFPLLLFFLTLFVGIGASYSAQLALYKFWILVAAVLVYYAITAVPRRYAWWIAGAATILAASLTLYFLSAGFWQRGLAFAGGFFPPFLRLLYLRPFWPLLLPHPNVIGGHIALLLPYGIALALYARREAHTVLEIGTAVCLVIALVGLLITRSVGAWFALAIGMGIWAAWPLSGWLTNFLPVHRRLLYGLLVGGMFCGGLLAAWLVYHQNLPGSSAITERLELANGAWRLVQDYSWLGSGLASFPALYAEYVQVVPNFFLSYSNFYLDVLLELGPFGAVCLLAVWVGAFWLLISTLRRSLARPFPHHGDIYWLRWATLSSLVIILVHGSVGNILFGGLGTPLLFFTPALAVLVSRRGPELQPLFGSKRVAWGAVIMLFLLIAVLLGFRQRVLADWHAYRGVWLMDHTVLTGWPRNQWRDGSLSSSLEPARQQFNQALAIDSHNRTAQQRLGMMALWARDTETAVDHLQQAYEQDPAHRGVVKSLGYAYVWQGQPDKAANFLSHIPEASQEMAAYAAFWDRLNQPYLAEQAAAMSSFLKENP